MSLQVPQQLTCANAAVLFKFGINECMYNKPGALVHVDAQLENCSKNYAVFCCNIMLNQRNTTACANL